MNLEYIYNYIYYDRFTKNCKEKWFYNKDADDVIESEELKEMNAFENNGQFIELFQMSEEKVMDEFMEELHSKEIDEYLSLFPVDKRYLGIEEIFIVSDESLIIENGDFGYYSSLKIIPLLNKWSLENNINIDTSIKKPENYIFDLKNPMSKIHIPTDGISLNRLISHITLENMYFEKRIYIMTDIDNYANLDIDIFKDCVKMPYYNESDLYKEFFAAMGFYDLKQGLHKCDDTEITSFIDSNQYMYDKYNDYKIECLKPIVINWCNKNNIRYICDIH